MCISRSADQVLFARTDFTTNLKTATITLFSLLHKGRLQAKIFTNVSETAVIFVCQVLRMVTEKVLKHCYFNTSSVVKPAISTFCSLGSSAVTRHY